MRTMTKRTMWIAGTALVIALPTAAAWAATDDPGPGEGRVAMIEQDMGWSGSMTGSRAVDGDTIAGDCAEHAGSDEMRGWRSGNGETMRSYHQRVTDGQDSSRMAGRGHMGGAGMWDGASD